MKEHLLFHSNGYVNRFIAPQKMKSPWVGWGRAQRAPGCFFHSNVPPGQNPGEKFHRTCRNIGVVIYVNCREGTANSEIPSILVEWQINRIGRYYNHPSSCHFWWARWNFSSTLSLHSSDLFNIRVSFRTSSPFPPNSGFCSSNFSTQRYE
uniref:Uncharacterized protein n=1 Tax=Candidatus Kentrum sp. FW TaxID=2126338 RepID=A0A450TSH9_9GAMM|nr:MAG: hypothetical protein BECKFW1821C_GA0114237_102718 [Candidatus Kentron sp. FW]